MPRRERKRASRPAEYQRLDGADCADQPRIVKTLGPWHLPILTGSGAALEEEPAGRGCAAAAGGAAGVSAGAERTEGRMVLGRNSRAVVVEAQEQARLLGDNEITAWGRSPSAPSISCWACWRGITARRRTRSGGSAPIPPGSVPSCFGILAPPHSPPLRA